MAPYEYRWLSLAELDPETWNAAQPDPRKPMHSWGWAQASTQGFSRSQRALVLQIGPPEHPRAHIAFNRRPGPFGWLELVGNEGGAVDVSYRTPEDAALVAQALLRCGSLVRLGDLPSDSAMLDALPQVRGRREIVVERAVPNRLSPYLDLDQSWAPPDAHLKKKMLSSLRRRERRLSEKGALRFEIERPTAETAQEALARAARVEMQGWKAGTKIALEKDPEQMDFFRAYAPFAARAGRLHLSFLSLDGTPIAMSIGEVFDGTYYAYKTGFDDRFRAQAPGILLQYKLIGALAGDGVARLDFQGHMDGFKAAWTDKAIMARHVRIYPLNHRGLFGVASDMTLALTRGLKRVLTRFKPASPTT